MKAEKLFTTKQAATILHYKNANTVKAMIHQGTIKAMKIGRDWVIPLSEIRRHLQRKGLV